jgi:hypothetical protein
VTRNVGRAAQAVARHYHDARPEECAPIPCSAVVVEIQPLIPEPECREKAEAV